MSRRNREKRAAKQKDRRRTARERTSASWLGSDRAISQHVLASAVRVAALCRCGDVDAHADQLLREFGAAGIDLDVAVDTVLADVIGALWKHGWTPVDLHETGRRRLEPEVVALLDEAVAVQVRRYAPATLHPRWRSAIVAAPEIPHVRNWAQRTGRGRTAALKIVLGLLGALHELPALQRVLPPPGEGRQSDEHGEDVDEKMLAKVRALLAKAESTEFPEEAEALSAKAQELMSRHALHRALYDHDRGRVPLATARRMWLESPYAGAKSHLVDAVATANRCRAVWDEQLGFVTVIGDDTDLETVELLTTSLLVQANRAMLAAGRHVTRAGTSRTRSFRQSFLIAYASRIGERLSAVDEEAMQRAEEDPRLLPVLAARSRAADELTEEMFPSLVQRSIAVSNAAGWGAGRAAADLALFDVHGAIAG